MTGWRFFSSGRSRVLASLATVTIAAAAIWLLQWEPRSQVETLIGFEQTLRRLIEEAPLAVWLMLFVGYAGLLWLPFPVTVPATVFVGWISGFAAGIVIVSFASTAAAAVTFSLTRRFLSFQQWNGAASRFATKSLPSSDACWLLLSLRLIPGVPFFVVNAGMASTRLTLSQFWAISQLGMLPATAAYVYAGRCLPKLSEIRELDLSQGIPSWLWIATAGMGCVALLKFATSQLGRRRRDRINVSLGPVTPPALDTAPLAPPVEDS